MSADAEPSIEPVDQRVYWKQSGWHDDLIKGWMFAATLQLRTPLTALEHHGDVIEEGTSDLPVYGPSWAGVWVPKTKTWREMGFDIDELPPGDSASEIGPIPSDGGEFLRLLKDYRRIIEGSGSVDERIGAVRLLLARKEYANIVARLGPRIDDSWAVEQLGQALGLTGGIARKLFDAGFRDAGSVRTATDASLRDIRGIGPGALQKIRGAHAPGMPGP